MKSCGVNKVVAEPIWHPKNHCRFQDDIASIHGQENMVHHCFGFLYIIEGIPNVSKIGITHTCPKKRISSIQTSLWFEPKIKYIAIQRNASAVERAVHRLFEDKRLKGEWFSLDSETIVWYSKNGRYRCGIDWRPFDSQLDYSEKLTRLNTQPVLLAA